MPSSDGLPAALPATPPTASAAPVLTPIPRRALAGMVCAWSLSRFPERFEVEVWETLPEVGGVASTCAIDGGAPAGCGSWG